jgi:hypothetical protein
MTAAWGVLVLSVVSGYPGGSFGIRSNMRGPTK